MSKRGKEWPLVAFTIAMQLACGLAMATTFCDLAGSPAEIVAARPLGIAIFPVLFAGIIVSLLHLGRPLEAWRSFSNLGSSRLSRELAATALFAVAALIDSGVWYSGDPEMRLGFGVLTVVAGLAAVVLSAHIYMVPAQAVWNAGWVPSSFLGTALLFGGLASATVVVRHESDVLRPALFAILVGTILLLLATYDMVTWLTRLSAEPAAASDAAQVLGSCRRWIALYVLLVGVLPIGVAFMLWPGAQNTVDVGTTPVLFAFAAALFGAALGRSIMYSLASLSRF